MCVPNGPTILWPYILSSSQKHIQMRTHTHTHKYITYQYHHSNLREWRCSGFTTPSPNTDCFWRSLIAQKKPHISSLYCALFIRRYCCLAQASSSSSSFSSSSFSFSFSVFNRRFGFMKIMSRKKKEEKSLLRKVTKTEKHKYIHIFININLIFNPLHRCPVEAMMLTVYVYNQQQQRLTWLPDDPVDPSFFLYLSLCVL